MRGYTLETTNVLPQLTPEELAEANALRDEMNLPEIQINIESDDDETEEIDDGSDDITEIEEAIAIEEDTPPHTLRVPNSGIAGGAGLLEQIRNATTVQYSGSAVTSLVYSMPPPNPYTISVGSDSINQYLGASVEPINTPEVNIPKKLTDAYKKGKFSYFMSLNGNEEGPFVRIKTNRLYQPLHFMDERITHENQIINAFGIPYYNSRKNNFIIKESKNSWRGNFIQFARSSSKHQLSRKLITSEFRIHVEGTDNGIMYLQRVNSIISPIIKIPSLLACFMYDTQNKSYELWFDLDLFELLKTRLEPEIIESKKLKTFFRMVESFCDFEGIPVRNVKNILNYWVDNVIVKKPDSIEMLDMDFDTFIENAKFEKVEFEDKGIVPSDSIVISKKKKAKKKVVREYLIEE